MSGVASRRVLGDGRWHFQHGPIDCIVTAEGRADIVAACIEHAWQRFRGVLDELVGELGLLRADQSTAPSPRGSVARRMVDACAPHASDGRFITAMAAVAGSVADELLVSFAGDGITRASINNGGDIALRLGRGTSFEVGLCADPIRGRFGAPLDGRFTVTPSSPVRGIATSGWRGRSFSLGIADAVTVLATSAARADAAATIVANAVDVADARIVRAPASSVRDDSDLGDRLVTRHVPALPPRLVDEALDRGAAEAEAQIRAGRIIAAVLALQGRWRVVGDLAATLTPALSRAAGEGAGRAPSPRLRGEGRGEGCTRRSTLTTETSTC
jgi:ApbE superfamily uncharacterized protein (UPF0280 family)